jgi:iron-sulfur cluster repair protein YtfE (RIC family)
VIADHLGYIVAALHHHHTAEDELLWPALYTRVPATCDLTIKQMEDAHAAIAEAVEKVQTVRSPGALRPAPNWQRS